MKLQELDQNEMTEINGGALLSSNLLGGSLGSGTGLSSLTGLLSGLGLGSGSGLSGLTGALTNPSVLSISIGIAGHTIGLNLGSIVS